MTPSPPPAKLPGPVVFLISFFLGSGCVGLVGGAAAWTLAKRAELNARRGWYLVPVVVAAKDLTPGTLVTMETVTQRSIPEQFVTDSTVKPDSVKDVIGRPVTSPVAAGEALRWSLVSRIEGFIPVKHGEVFDACADEVGRRWAGDVDQTPAAQRARVRRLEAP
ncbi:MAG: SAF domain-containing protein [Myxococcaceae bacterium]|nr:SAF domain-containing protein [Myxococcaceae bacterium]